MKLMSINIQGIFLNKLPNISSWIKRQTIAPVAIAVQETHLVEQERKSKQIEKSVARWLPEYIFIGTTSNISRSKGVGLLIARM